MFDEADRNNDGVLTTSEIKAYLKNHMQLKGQLMQDKGYQELFNGLDADGDSQVSRAEWTKYYVSKAFCFLSSIATSSYRLIVPHLASSSLILIYLC